MIKRLRRKFIIINMALVATVLLIVFAMVFISSYQQQRSDSLMAMRMAVSREAGLPPLRFSVGGDKRRQEPEKAMPLLPVFTVTLDEGSGIRMVDVGNVEVEDEVITQAVERAVATGESEGILRELNLRFMREYTPHGVRYAFLDQSVEQTAMTKLVTTLLLVGVGGLAAFFFISLFLANWALRPVERAWAQQQRFVADASHELKTPLTVILANLGIMQGRPGETVAEQSQWIENTREEATRMRKLVDGLLFLAKSDAAEAPVEWATFSLSDAVWRCVLSFEPVAYEQGVTLTSDIAPDVLLLGDEGQLVQLVTILLDNACKYAGPHGAVLVKLAAAQDKLTLSVNNTGEPLSEDELSHVFERFYRADAARVHVQGGYGLGLSIAAQITHQHGGRIQAGSDAREGTTFSVTLPAGGRTAKNLAE